RRARDLRLARRRGLQASRDCRDARYHERHVEAAAPPRTDAASAALEWAMTMHEGWTDKLSEYVDDELSPAERADVDAHLRNCRDCAKLVEDLSRVVTRAGDLTPRPPRADLWAGIEQRLGTEGLGGGRFGIGRLSARRFTFTFAQLSAAAVLLIAASATL